METKGSRWRSSVDVSAARARLSALRDAAGSPYGGVQGAGWSDVDGAPPAGRDGERGGNDDAASLRAPAARHRAVGSGAPAPSRWLPASWASVLLDPGRRGAVALVASLVLAASAAVLVSVHAHRSDGAVDPPVLVGSPTGSPLVTGGTTAPGPSSGGAATTIVVAVTGDVVHPGVVTLPAGSRVVDAVRVAGGARRPGDVILLNLARRLADGELVVVGSPAQRTEGTAPGADGAAARGSSPEGGPDSGPVNLNTATTEQLDGLPGVGPVLAQRIAEWRTEHGGFRSVDQLGDVSGIGDAKLSQLRPRVTV